MQQKKRLATSVETSGVNLRTRTKQSGTKEQARRKKCDVRFSIASGNRVFEKNCMRIGVRKLSRRSVVLARVRGGQAVGISPTERLKLR